jgi:hypothetical protein
MSGITKDQWPLFAKDIFRICKPGTGWAQLIEACAYLSCDDGSVPKDSPIWEVILSGSFFFLLIFSINNMNTRSGRLRQAYFGPRSTLRKI